MMFFHLEFGGALEKISRKCYKNKAGLFMGLDLYSCKASVVERVLFHRKTAATMQVSRDRPAQRVEDAESGI